jgi:hypothetical protein
MNGRWIRFAHKPSGDAFPEGLCIGCGKATAEKDKSRYSVPKRISTRTLLKEFGITVFAVDALVLPGLIGFKFPIDIGLFVFTLLAGSAYLGVRLFHWGRELPDSIELEVSLCPDCRARRPVRSAAAGPAILVGMLLMLSGLVSLWLKLGLTAAVVIFSVGFAIVVITRISIAVGRQGRQAPLRIVKMEDGYRLRVRAENVAVRLAARRPS